MGKLFSIPFILMGMLFINLCFSELKEGREIKRAGVKTIATIITKAYQRLQKCEVAKVLDEMVLQQCQLTNSDPSTVLYTQLRER